jgi:hypothetical protein
MADDYSFDDVPNRPAILQGIESLEPIFLEAHRRSKGLELFPHAYTLLKNPKEISADNQDGTFVEHGGAWESRTLPGSAAQQVGGYFRWSGALELYMPTEIPEDTDAYCPSEVRDAWTASTSTDDDYIESYAKETTRSDLDTVKDAYELVFEQCQTWRIGAALPHLNKLAEGIDNVIAAHEDKEFEQVAELFENWEGDDADACYEVFGQQLNPAAANHRQMLADLVRSAHEEAIEQGKAMSSLHNAIVQAHEGIQEATSREDYGIVATKRFIGKILVGRVPYLGDALAVHDFYFEVTSDGKVVDRSNGPIDWLMDKIWPNYGNVPTTQLVSEVRDDLLTAADDLLNNLYDMRNLTASDYLDEAADDWGNQITCQLIPGYVD